MSVPFSNAHIQVPRGFGNLLEGLTREILRDQPDDIPTFAALYFNGLLKERAENQLDPAEWTAGLADRFYNRHSFKTEQRPGGVSGAGERGAVTAGAKNDEARSLSNSKMELVTPIDMSMVSTGNFDSFKGVPGVENEAIGGGHSDINTAVNRVKLEDELSHKSTYSSVANKDICAEELRDPDGVKFQIPDGGVKCSEALDVMAAMAMLDETEKAEVQDEVMEAVGEFRLQGMVTPEHLLQEWGADTDHVLPVEETEGGFSSNYCDEMSPYKGPTEEKQEFSPNEENLDGDEGSMKYTNMSKLREIVNASAGKKNAEKGDIVEGISESYTPTEGECVLDIDAGNQMKEEHLQRSNVSSSTGGDDIQQRVEKQPLPTNTTEKVDVIKPVTIDQGSYQPGIHPGVEENDRLSLDQNSLNMERKCEVGRVDEDGAKRNKYIFVEGSEGEDETQCTPVGPLQVKAKEVIKGIDEDLQRDLEEQWVGPQQTLYTEKHALADEYLKADEHLLTEEHPLTEEHSVTEEQIIMDEYLISDEHLLSEEHPLTEEHSITEEQPITDKYRIADEHLLTEKHPLTEEHSVIEEQPITDEYLIADEHLLTKEHMLTEEHSVTEEQPIRDRHLIAGLQEDPLSELNVMPGASGHLSPKLAKTAKDCNREQTPVGQTVDLSDIESANRARLLILLRNGE